MSRQLLRLLLLMLLPLASSLVLAAAPTTLGYQGNLANSAGQPITANLTITFRLFEASSGGTALWTEVQTGIDVDGGNLSVELGSVTPLPANIWGRQLYLGVQVAGDSEMSPRPALTAAPYALRAAGTMQRTLVVSAEGTPSENGAALLVAVATITDATATSPVVVEVDAGTFDLGTASLVMPSNTVLAGRGQTATVITSAVATPGSAQTVLLSSHSAARDLTARNTGVPPGDADSAVGIGAFAPLSFAPITNVRIERVTGESIAATGSLGQRAGITICSSNSVVTDVTGVAVGGLFAMALRANCDGYDNLVIDGATLIAEGARDGIRGTYLTAGFGNEWRRLRIRLGVSPSVQTVFGIRFLNPNSFFAPDLQGKLSDVSITIGGGNLATPTSTGRIEGITLDNSAQLALIEDVSVNLDRVKARNVTGVRLLENANNAVATARLIDVEVRVTAVQDAALGFGEIVGVLAEGYPPELIRTEVVVDCLAGGSSPCIGIAQPDNWAALPGTLVVRDSSIQVGHLSPVNATAPTQSVLLQVAGPTRVLNSSLRVSQSTMGEQVFAVRHLAQTAITDMLSSALVATNAANSNALCVLAGTPGSSGEWFGNHIQGSRCDSSAINLTCAGNTQRGTGFLAATCP
jgi:hypothetical protein